MIKDFKASICATIVILLVVAAFFASPVFAQGSGSTAISSAQINLQNCYESVKQAQAAGANVDSLMVTLNQAAGLLTQAQLAYASGDYGSANNYASQSQSALAGVSSQADSLKANAQNVHTENSVIFLLSILGSLAILCLGLIAFAVLGRKGRNT